MEFETFSLTRTQLRVLERPDIGNNRCAVYRLEGEFDEARLARAIYETVQRCPPFSYKFLKIDGGLQILLSPDNEKIFRTIDVDDGDAVFTLIENFRQRVFRLDGGAPFLFCLLRGKTVSHLVFSCHPGLIDRFSLKPLFTAISKSYRGEAEQGSLGLGQEILLAEEKTRMESPQLREGMRFWLQVLQGASFEWRPPRLEGELSDDYFRVSLSAKAKASAEQAAARLGIALDNLLVFCFHIFLYRMTRNESVMTAHCHRLNTAQPDQIGFNENKPLLRSFIDPEMTARQYCTEAERFSRQTKYHSDLPFGLIARDLLRLEPDFRWPTNVLFDKDSLPYQELVLDGVSATLLPHFSHRLAIEDIAVYYDPREEIAFHVMTRSQQEVAGLKMAFEHYLTLLEYINEDLDQPIGVLRLMDRSQQETALRFADGGALPVPAEDVLVRFARLCETSPEAPALRYADRSLTYRMLSTSAGSIASHLKSFTAAKTDPLVGLCLGRSERMIQAAFGVLAAGAGYLPLDPTMPAERLAFIIDDAQLTAVIADAESIETVSAIVACPVVNVADLLDAPCLVVPPADVPKTARSTAYVIYTSGTTGKPKGVVIERGMLAHYVAALEGLWDRGPGSHWLQFASLNFDASVLEIFSPLCHGGELVITPSEVRADPQAIANLLLEANITHAFLPPAMLRLLPRRPLPKLRAIFSGGEAPDEDSVRFWSKTVELANVYGPTETTVMATCNKMGGFKSANHLGRPLSGYFTYILSANGELAPIGGIGEICIGGNGVAREYLGRPDLTAQKFTPNPFANGRIYHSGDLGRFLPNGEIEFLGRGDFQVKIRGFRIELGDIETVIAEQPEIRGSYVGVFDRPGGKTILAWYVAPGLTEEVLRNRLASRLPQYMIPTFLIPIDSFPLNIGGKIDRTRLPMPENKPVEIFALDELDAQVRDIWAATLGVQATAIGSASHFFHLGGHSLLAALVCNRINALLGCAVRPKTLFEHPGFADFCQQIRATPHDLADQNPLIPCGKMAGPCQSRIIRLIYSRALRYQDDNTYNIVIRIDFSAEIHPIRLRKVFWELLEAHPVFRIAFQERGDQIWIKADKRALPPIPLIDTSRAATDARTEEMRSEVLGVKDAPLWRAEVHCREDGTSTILFNVHHAIFDGWSSNLLLEELAERYEAAQAERVYKRERMNWFDYCYWAIDLPQTVSFQQSIAYWQEKLTGIDLHVELPRDFRQKQDNANKALPLRLAPEIVARLKTLADAQDVTMSPLLFSLWLVWLWRISGQESLTCGYPYAGRDVPGSENIYGMFVTMGLLHQPIQPKQAMTELIRTVHRQMLEDKDHLTATPYDAESGDISAMNVVFSLQSGIGLEGGFGGARFKADELPSLTSKADLTGIFYQSSDGGIEGRIEYDSSLFREETVASFLEVFKSVVVSAAHSPEARVDELAYQSEVEQGRFLEMACGAPLHLPDTSIPARFAELVQTNPDHVALVFGERQQTYRELDDWSSRIAAGLAGRISPGSRVGLAMQKGDTLIASVLAILKLGSAYVPLDPSYPPDRLRFFVENAGVQWVLADAFSRDTLIGMGLGALDFVDPSQCDSGPAAALPAVAADSLAYIIHTSGSTGQPKGVMIEHRSVVRLAVATAQELDCAPDSRGSLVASMNFDASVLEIFTMLLNGLTLVVIAEEARKSPALLHQMLGDQRISHAMLSPVVLQNLPRKPLPDMKMIGFGGDMIDGQTADWWSRQTRLFSLYGPTETTVMASCGLIPPGESPATIGKPLAGYRLYLLNPYKQPVPMGAVGEICIGGSGLARGYLNRDDLSLERFVLDPFGGSPYALMYLTGDLGRFLADGSIEFFGRNDAQVKVRGFRIELGEIENSLSTFPGIRHVVCAAKGEGDNRYLAAYYVAEEELDENGMRQHVGKFLPEYMVPAFFVRLAALPASPSGKIDRKALPAVSGKVSANPPQPGLEQQIAAIWENLLRYHGIGRDESFFRVGGNSLLAVRMQSEVQKQLGLEFSIAEFYGAPTIEALASRQQTNYIEMAISDAEAPLTIERPATEKALIPPETVLLTGASGFLGVFLLAELGQKCQRVLCLQRCKEAEEGLAAIRRQAEKAGVSIPWERITLVPGDLSEPDLGLSREMRRSLAREVDAIVHCGAFVHHLHNYQTMKAANVDSTVELLKLALEEQKKLFCFVSTLSVASALAGLPAAPEVIVDNLPVADMGYLLTKWTAEKLVARATELYGLDAVIARPGNITGCTTNGFSNFEHNHFWLFNKGCLQLGAYPKIPALYEMTPVDVLARAIAALVVSPRQGLTVSNLANPQTMTLTEFFGRMTELGFSVTGEEPAVWQQRLETIGEDNALSQIKEFYTGDISAPPFPVEQSKTLADLARLGVDFATSYDDLLPVYVDYLQKKGFLS